MKKEKLKIRRILSSVLILLLFINITNIVIFKEKAKAETNMINFEGNDSIMYFAYGGASINFDKSCTYNGESSIKVTNRNSVWDGLAINVKDIIKNGTNYVISSYVRHSYKKPVAFAITAVYEDGKDIKYIVLGEVVAVQNTWKKIVVKWNYNLKKTIKNFIIVIHPVVEKNVEFNVDYIKIMDEKSYLLKAAIYSTGFESGSAEGWQGTGNGITLKIDESQAHFGKKCLYVKNSNSGWHAAQISIDKALLQKGKVYKFSLWMYQDCGYSQRITLLMQKKLSTNSSIQYEWLGNKDVDSDNWIEVTGNYTVPEGENINELSLLIIPQESNLSFWIDDFRIYDISKLCEPEKEIPSLVNKYKNDFRIGVALGYNEINSSDEKKLILKHFNSITPGNEMKPSGVLVGVDKYNFDKADAFVNFALSNNMTIRGHTLVWHNQTPEWFFKDANGKTLSKSALLNRLKQYIYKVVGRYKGKVYAWDVVNEAIDESQIDGYRRSDWYNICGPEFIEKAFIWAHEADPKAKLFYNDYNTEVPKKREFIYNMVKKFKAKGIPISGVGLQTHISLYGPSISEYEQTLKLFSSIPGLEIHVTELDMSFYQWGSSDYYLRAPRDMLIKQAKRYKELFDLLLKYKKTVKNVTFWGYKDDYSWLRGLNGKNDYPLLFDENYIAKYSFWNLIDSSIIPKEEELPTPPPIKIPIIITKPVGKIYPNGNPLISHKFGADPYVLVYKDRVYLYLTNDNLEYDENGKIKDNSYGKINKITVISSDDLVNWTDHGEINVAGSEGAAKWAIQSWAPAVAHKVINGKDRFFLYFANNASNIGVLTTDSPIGPWKDPIGRPLITRSTPGVENVTWLFDPAVLLDNDGKAYIYFGGGIPEGKYEMPNTARVMQLGDDMISVTGKAVTIPAPFMFEDSGINKFNNNYFYTYCTNFYDGTRPEGTPPGGVIAYMTSKSPIGPWKYGGVILKNPGYYFGVGGNNHHMIFEYRGKWYITYHAQTLAKDMGFTNGYRSPHLNEIHFNDNGTIDEIVADYNGVKQVRNLNPYRKVEAVTFAWEAGITTKNIKDNNGNQHMVLTDIHNGDWIALSKVDFGNKGASEYNVNALNINSDGIIELHLDGVNGKLIGTTDIKLNNEKKDGIDISCKVTGAQGVHDLYFVFKGNTNKKLFDLDYWQFK